MKKNNEDFLIFSPKDGYPQNYNEFSDSAIKDEDGTIHFGKWAVTKSGDMIWDDWYGIYDNQLTKDDWIHHMFSKGWIDWNEFMPAYFQALKNAKIQFVKIRIFF